MPEVCIIGSDLARNVVQAHGAGGSTPSFTFSGDCCAAVVDTSPSASRAGRELDRIAEARLSRHGGLRRRL